MKHANGSKEVQAMILEIWIPQRAEEAAMKALQRQFPYRRGEWLEQSFTGQKDPTGFHLAFIHLAEDLANDQVHYLESSKHSGLIARYDVYE